MEITGISLKVHYSVDGTDLNYKSREAALFGKECLL